MSKLNSQAEEWVCIVLGDPGWFFVPGKSVVTEILMEKKEQKNPEEDEKCFLAASRELELVGVFLKSFFLAH